MTSEHFVPFFLFLTLQWSSTIVSAIGLPLEACDTLVPDLALTQTPSEYQLDLSKFRDVAGKYSYVPGEAYQLTLAGEGLLTFRGFMLQARQVLNDSAPAGRFAVLDDVNTQLSQCKPPEISVVHSNDEDKHSVSTLWTAPPPGTGPITFRYTVVSSSSMNVSTEWIFEAQGSQQLNTLASTSVLSPKVTVSVEPMLVEEGQSFEACFSIPESPVGDDLLVNIQSASPDISLDVNFTFAEGTAQLVQCIDNILVRQDDIFEGTEGIESSLFNITTTYNGITESYLGGSLYIADQSIHPVHFEQTFYQFFENTANLVSVVIDGSIGAQGVDLTLSVDAIPRSAEDCTCPDLACEELLLPFGMSSGDSLFPSSPDGHSGPLVSTDTLTDAFQFYGVSQDTIFVNENGVLSFAEPYPLPPTPESTFPLAPPAPALVSPLGQDIFLSGGGDILYRYSTNQSLLDRVGKNISDAFAVSFSPLLLFVVTWDQVPGAGNFSLVNTYQSVLATDGNATYILFLYKDIQWVDNTSSAGLNAGDGVRGFNLLEEIAIVSPLELPSASNVGIPGAYYFRVDLEDVTQPVLCDSPAVLPNGTVSFSGHFIGDTATYSCDGGLGLFGEAVVTCERTTEDSAAFIPDPPVCRVVCTTIAPANGAVTASTVAIGDTVMYTCHEGFELIGEANVSCVETAADIAEFSSPPPICQQTCNIPPAPANGRSEVNGTSIGDIVTYTCEEGFEPIGETQGICVLLAEENRAEFSQQAPSCRPECAAPVPPTNGMVQSSGVSVGDAAAYSCDQGSELIGTVLAICTQIDSDSAVFAPSAPLCAPQCVHPGAPANGDVLVTGLSLGDTATYTCEEGFGLVGEETATCVELDANSAAFSSESPICLAIPVQFGSNSYDLFPNIESELCVVADDASPVTASVEVVAVYNDPEPVSVLVATLIFYSETESGRECFSSGILYDIIPETADMAILVLQNAELPLTAASDSASVLLNSLCPDPAAPSNGDVTHSSNTVGSLAEYTCSEGYVLVGATSATCVETGLRSAQFLPAAPLCNVDTTDIQFAQSSYEILEDIGSDDSALRVCLIVSQLASERSVRILTVSGTAQGSADVADRDYEHLNTEISLTFAEDTVCLGISILEDSVPEEDETFQVVVAGLGIVTEVKILDDDDITFRFIGDTPIARSRELLLNLTFGVFVVGATCSARYTTDDGEVMTTREVDCFSGIAEIRLGRKFVEYTPVVTVTRSDGKIISSADPSRTFYPGLRRFCVVHLINDGVTAVENSEGVLVGSIHWGMSGHRDLVESATNFTCELDDMEQVACNERPYLLPELHAGPHFLRVRPEGNVDCRRNRWKTFRFVLP